MISTAIARKHPLQQHIVGESFYPFVSWKYARLPGARFCSFQVFQYNQGQMRRKETPSAFCPHKTGCFFPYDLRILSTGSTFWMFLVMQSASLKALTTPGAVKLVAVTKPSPEAVTVAVRPLNTPDQACNIQVILPLLPAIFSRCRPSGPVPVAGMVPAGGCRCPITSFHCPLFLHDSSDVKYPLRISDMTGQLRG